MDIRSGCGYPGSQLSNFAPHEFVIDGVVCQSMEGFLQSLKFKDIEIQKYVCTLVGIKAKNKGRNKKWWQTQTLWWQGNQMKRNSLEYADLLDRAYLALSKNNSFRTALLKTGDAVLSHSIGKNKESETVLTEREFCSRLMWLRNLINKGEI